MLLTLLTTTAGLAITVSPAAAGPTYQVIDADNDPYAGIYLRQGTSMGNVTRTAEWYITYGTSVELLCGTWGEAVGPRANRRWHQVRVLAGSNTGRVGWVADRFMNTPNASNQPTPGEAECGATTTTTPSQPSSGSAGLEVWCGSPVDGNYPTWSGSYPQHHGQPYGGDVEFDIPAGANQSAQIFCAPQDGRSAVTAKVESVRPACRSRVIADGGHYVQVGLYNGTARIGFIGISHVNPSVSVGQEISRWGGTIGTIGSYRRNSCWDGTHAHVALYSTTTFACANTTYASGQRISKSNFIGFLSRGRARAATCP